ncbi:histone H1-like [Engraulis encrasicolus]|uniref:histone H1-like n=1 Tax=Engraulis encrasicolus TaxID=184585 RepID=UPI002FD204D2
MADEAQAAPAPAKPSRKQMPNLPKARPCVGKLSIAITSSQEKKRGVSLAALRRALAEADPAKTAKRTAKKSPSVGELVVKAVTASKDRNGISLAAVKSALSAGGYGVQKNNSRVKMAIKSLVNKGTLVQTNGTGASGSFKLNKQQVVAKKKAAAKNKKPTKNVVAAKKTVVKKLPQKSPQKVRSGLKNTKKATAPKQVNHKPLKAKRVARK